MAQAAASVSPYAETERRIAWLTLATGFVAAVVVGLLHNWSWAGGILIGAALAWINFRWLKQGLDALVGAAMAQEGAEKARVPLGAYFKMVFRYGLIALGVYAIFFFLQIPIVSMLAGLCALGIATMGASLYEVLYPSE